MVKCVIALLAVFCIGIAAQAAEDVTVKGEVIDIVGYAVKGDFGKGEDHSEEGTKNVKAGLPVGILDDQGTLYTVVTSKMQPANEQLAPQVGKTVTAKGKAVYVNGINLLMMQSMKPEPADAATTASQEAEKPADNESAGSEEKKPE